MNPLRYALLSALLSPLVEDDETTEQEPGAQATGKPAEQEHLSEVTTS